MYLDTSKQNRDQKRLSWRKRHIMAPHLESQLSLICALAPGLLFLTIGIVLIIKRIWFLRHARDVWGEVISMEERYPFGPFHSWDQPAIPCALPKVRFTANNGITYEFVAYATTRFLSYQVGGFLPVVYNPKDPRKAYIKHMLPLWSGPVSISGLGIVLLLFVFLASLISL